MGTRESPTILAPTSEEIAGRLMALDVFRGLAVAGMIFVNNVVAGAGVPATLRHSAWNGLTFSDAIFPSFLFVVGVSMAYSFARSARLPRAEFIERFLSRTGLLFAFGLIGNWVFALALGAPGVRIQGVLQRIALSSLVAAPFARSRTRWVLIGAAMLLAVHTALLVAILPPGAVTAAAALPGSTTAAWVDRFLLGPGYSGGGLDPENFLGVLSSSAGVLLGVATGRTLIRHSKERRGLLPLVVGGAATLALGVALSPWLPVNKRLWTATFVLVVSGADAIILAAMYYLIDVKGHRSAAGLAVPMGLNALALFIGSQVLDGMLLWLRVPSGARAYEAATGGLQTLLGPAAGSMAFATAGVALWYAVALALDSRHVYVKL